MSRSDLPDKIYFRIGEVCDLLDLEPHVLRYWETEFDVLKPAKSKTGQRLYRRKDVEALNAIKDLLYKQRFTIKGARQFLRTTGLGKASAEKARRDEGDMVRFLQGMRGGLKKLRDKTEKLASLVDKKRCST